MDPNTQPLACDSDLFSRPVLSLQSPRASCLPFLQACSRCGPPWAPFHPSHLPPAQERLRPLRPPVQVSLSGAVTTSGREEWKQRPLTLTDFLSLLFSSPSSAQWSSHNHSCFCRLCPGTWLCPHLRGCPRPGLPLPSSLDGHATATTLW